MQKRTGQAITLLAVLLTLFGCKKPESVVEPNGFPKEIGTIISTSCATTGCHNATSYQAAGGLNLSTWETLFEGSRGGSAVVPFSPDQSFFLYFTNTDPDFGPVLSPTMPLDGTPLDSNQIQLISDWIQEGAPSCAGEYRFPDVPDRKKYYVANQGCDLVSVIDAESQQIMRYVEVGQINGFVESPHMVRVSPDGQFWYLIFLANNPYVEKYSTLTDSLVATINIGQGDWNTFALSPDGKYGFAVAYALSRVVAVDLELETKVGELTWPRTLHGSDMNPNANQLYVTEQDGDAILVVEFNPPFSIQNVYNVDMEQNIPRPVAASFSPHEVRFAPGGDKYLVTCQGTNEVRIFQTSNDSLLAAVQVGDFPQELAFSENFNYGFASCMEDLTTFSGDPAKRGSIAIIDLTSNSLVTSVYSGFQPHGMDVDEETGYLYIGNRNSNPTGPAPHHTSECGGRNGYLTRLNLQTLEIDPDYQFEVSVDPYSVAVKY